MRLRRRRDDAPEPVEDVEIRDEMIRLGQFLKLANLIDSGSDAKLVLADGAVEVNGTLETRRGRQLVDGDVVGFAGRRVRVRRSSQPRL